MNSMVLVVLFSVYGSIVVDSDISVVFVIVVSGFMSLERML